MLAFPSCMKATMEVSGIDSKKKGLLFYYFSVAVVLTYLNSILDAQLIMLLI